MLKNRNNKTNRCVIVSAIAAIFAFGFASAAEIAATAFYRLLARIADPDLPAMECLLPVRLMARGSTARPKRRPRNR